MSHSEQLGNINTNLEQFGLNKYENAAYLSLMQLGLADARTISENSNVPYGRIYDTLGSLKSKRVINEIDGRPKQYTVVEPDIAINYLLEEKQKRLKKLENKAEKTIQELNKVYQNKPHDKLVWKVAIGDELYPTYFDLLAEARNHFYGYLELSDNTKHEMTYFHRYYGLLQDMHNKGITMKIILGIDNPEIISQMIDMEPAVMQLFNLAEIRYTSHSHLGFSIIDKEKVILKVVNPVKVEEMLAGIYLWQKPLAKTMMDSFEDMWEDAKPLNLSLKY